MSVVTRAEGSRLVRTYRRVAPVALRRFIAAAVQPETRNRMLLRMAAVRSGVGREAACRALLGLRERRWARGTWTAVRAAGQVRVARVDPAATPLSVRQYNGDLARRALGAAGVEFFTVRGSSPSRTVLGVSAEHRGRVLKALAELARKLPGYARVIDELTGSARPLLPLGRAASAKRFRDAGVVRLVWYVTTSRGGPVFGDAFGCEIEFWEVRRDELAAPRRNTVTQRLPRHDATVIVPGELFCPLASVHRPVLPQEPTRAQFAAYFVDDVLFPIDVVYTWVDGDDAQWRARRDATLAQVSGAREVNAHAASDARYENRDELRYSLRSLDMYAPWVRRVFLVTDRQVPDWLDLSNPRVTVVDHTEIFGDPGCLPTFNSHAIESQLHRIPGLSEHFLYMNDDVFLGAALTPQTFFHANGVAKFFRSPSLVDMGTPSVADSPVVAAGKNNRQLIAESFGRVLTQKMKHTPHPLRRSVLQELEDRYPGAHAETASHRFRHPGDVSVTSSLHQYYGYFAGHCVPGELDYAYADLAHRNTPRRLTSMLARRDKDVFCLNDTGTESGAGRARREQQTAMLRQFLEGYFPVPSSFEK
ncbi:stealth family protein [Actinomycetota bacterium Odt1-20B]